MYPTHELSRLARHKEGLQRRITRRRAECVAAATRITRPFAWLDRALILWRQWSPWVQIAALPLGLLGKRPKAARPFGPFLRWLPLISGVVSGFRAVQPR